MHCRRRRLKATCCSPQRRRPPSTPNPWALALGKFLASLAPEQLDRLRSLLKPRTTTVLSGASIEEIYELLRGWHPSSPASSLVPELSPEASRTLASKKEAFNELLRFIRGVLDELLHRYAASHPKVRIRILRSAFLYVLCVFIYIIALAKMIFVDHCYTTGTKVRFGCRLRLGSG